MKKISIISALLATALCITSCEDDKSPKVHVPGDSGNGSFTLNTPPLANQYFELTPENSIEFTTSQPDYGFTASVTYSLEMKISQDADAQTYILTPAEPTSAKIVVSGKQIAEGMCALRGITAVEDWTETDPMPVYIRAIAQLGMQGNLIEESAVTSNWVTLSAVTGYCAVREPGYIYFVGQPEGWKGPSPMNAAHYADWRLFEKQDQIDSKVYWGVFDIAAGEAMFRFYTTLTDWDTDSYGSQVDDNPIDKDLENGQGTFELVKGKGAFNFPAWEGGLMTICVDMSKPSDMKMYIMTGDQM